MKKYFDFTLKARVFLPIWLTLYVLVIVPYFFLSRTLSHQNGSGQPEPWIAFLMILILLVAGLVSFFIYRLMIESIRYGDNQVKFSGGFWTFVSKVIVGFLLSVITLFIYMAWFIRDITRFFVNNSSLNSENFRFRGKGGALFLIILLTMLIPILLFSFLVFRQLSLDPQSFSYRIISQGIVILVMIPYMYMIYKWMINIDYKNYHIHWKTNFFDSCLKILVEILLSMITLGIYTPLAYLRLYQYFVERTVAEREGSVLNFGFDLEPKKAFLFVWGQTLLTIVTLGIYYPWALEKIGKWVLSKTFSMKQEG